MCNLFCNKTITRQKNTTILLCKLTIMLRVMQAEPCNSFESDFSRVMYLKQLKILKALISRYVYRCIFFLVTNLIILCELCQMSIEVFHSKLELVRRKHERYYTVSNLGFRELSVSTDVFKSLL